MAEADAIVSRHEDDRSRPVASVERCADRGHDLGMDPEDHQGLVGDALALQEPTRGLEPAQLEPRCRVPLSGGPAGIEPGGGERVLEPGDLRGGQVRGDLPVPLARVRVDDLDHPDRGRGGDGLLREEAGRGPEEHEGACQPNVSM